MVSNTISELMNIQSLLCGMKKNQKSMNKHNHHLVQGTEYLNSYKKSKIKKCIFSERISNQFSNHHSNKKSEKEIYLYNQKDLKDLDLKNKTNCTESHLKEKSKFLRWKGTRGSFIKKEPRGLLKLEECILNKSEDVLQKVIEIDHYAFETSF